MRVTGDCKACLTYRNCTQVKLSPRVYMKQLFCVINIIYEKTKVATITRKGIQEHTLNLGDKTKYIVSIVSP